MTRSLHISYRDFKRICDIVVAVLLILLLSPVLGIITIVLCIELKESPFFFQKRVGYQNRVFTIIKFKTMKSLISCPESTPYLDDRRLTQLTRIIRISGLDELPELVNITLGHMSFVGPRPLLISYLPLYSSSELHRHDVLPGITGLAQVNGKEQLPFRLRFKYDLFYVRNMSFLLDLYIVIKTVTSILCSLYRPKYTSHVDLPTFKR